MDSNLVNTAGAGRKEDQKVEDFLEIQNRDKSNKEIHGFVIGLRNNNIPEADIPKVLTGMGISDEAISSYFNEESSPVPAPSVSSQMSNPPAHHIKEAEPSSQVREEAPKQAPLPSANKVKQEGEVGSIFKVPTAVVELPSGGHFYNGKSSVEVKYLTASEDDILFSPELIRKNKAIDALLEAVVQGRDLRPSQMLTGDRNFLIMFVRRTGFGDDYDTGSMMCGSCGHVHSPIVDLSELKMKPLEITPDGDGWYGVLMPTSKINIRFRLLTGEDEDYLQKKTKSSGKKVGNFRVPATLTEKYLLQIMEVDGQKDKIYIKSFIDAMPMLDSNFLREYVSGIEPGIDLNYCFVCPSCGDEEEKDIPIGPKLFYPNSDI